MDPQRFGTESCPTWRNINVEGSTVQYSALAGALDALVFVEDFGTLAVRAVLYIKKIIITKIVLSIYLANESCTC